MSIIPVNFSELSPLVDAQSAGFQASREQVLELEERLQSQPDELVARVTVAAHYGMMAYSNSRDEQHYAEHLCWMTDNVPENPIHRYISLPVKEAAVGQQLKDHWLEQIRRHPKNIVVLDNAAHCISCCLWDRKTAAALLRRALRLMPDNEDIARELSFVYQLSGQSIAQRKRSIRTAVKYFFIAWRLHKRHPCHSYLDATVHKTAKKLADEALELKLIDTAKQLGQLLVRLKPELKTRTVEDGSTHTNWYYTDAVYHGNVVLGKAAFLLKDYRGAKMRLAKMCKQFPIRFADWQLAQNLLDHGERETVIEYIKASQLQLRKEHKVMATAKIEVSSGKYTEEEARTNWRARLKAEDQRMKGCIAAIRRGEKVVLEPAR